MRKTSSPREIGSIQYIFSSGGISNFGTTKTSFTPFKRNVYLPSIRFPTPFPLVTTSPDLWWSAGRRSSYEQLEHVPLGPRRSRTIPCTGRTSETRSPRSSFPAILQREECYENIQPKLWPRYRRGINQPRQALYNQHYYTQKSDFVNYPVYGRPAYRSSGKNEKISGLCFPVREGRTVARNNIPV